jgi:anaerobic magnesium-protoporphyrin IX monomethyl ester cyclase
MKILLLNPPRYKGVLVIREERCEVIEGISVLVPYSLLQIGSLIENNVEDIKLIDANALNLSFEELEKQMKEIDYDILIFRFTPTSFNEDIKAADISKRIKPKAMTVGICYSLGSIPKQIMKEAKDMDIYVRHEYDAVIPELIKNISKLSKVAGIAYRDKKNKKRIIVNKDAKPVSDYDSLPIPAFHLLPSLDLYHISVNHGKPFTILYTSKGCPYTCMFCNVSQSKLRIKSVNRIMKEIDFLKKNYNIRTISFYDETFTLDKKRIYELCRRIRKYNIKWYCNTRANLVDLNLLKAMRKAGCSAISYGIESGSQKILDSVSKRNTVQQNADAIKWAHMAGIKTHCSFILGLPGETKETIEETISFIKKTLPMSLEFNIATPYPGTELNRYFVKKGIIKKNINWHKLYQDSAQFENREISNEYIEKIREKAYLSLYLNPRWFFRNLFYTIRNPDDFTLAFRYVIKIWGDYFNRFYVVRKKE